MGLLGLVTVLYKSEDVLDGFFRSISSQIYKKYVLYLVDNSPSFMTDSLINGLLQKYPLSKVVHIKNEINVGVAAGNNIGIRKALTDECNYILLLNNDIEFYQNYLFSNLIEEGSKGLNHLLVPKILFFDTKKIWMAGGRLDLWKPMTVHIGEGEDDGEKFDSPKLFNYAPTCFMLLPKSAFEEIGLMDEKYFVYFDDTDFLHRAKKKNYKVYYLPNLTVLHKISTSTGGKESPFSIYYGNRNRIYFIRKHLSGPLFLSALIYTLFTRLIKLSFYYNREQRKKAIQGMLDGIKVPL